MTHDDLLRGAFDLHVHCAPDSVPRAQSAFELAKEAVSRGMAGVGLKDHTCSTVGRCHVLNESFAGRVRFYSSLALNPTGFECGPGLRLALGSAL